MLKNIIMHRNMKKMKSENIFMVKNCFQSDVRTCKSM